MLLHLLTACEVSCFAHVLDLNDGVVVLISNQFKRPVLQIVLDNLVMELASDKSFCVEHRVLRICRDLRFRCLSNQSVSVREGNDGRSCPISHIVRNNLHSVIFPYSDAGISKNDQSRQWKARCSKINSDTISLYVWNSKKKQIPDFVIADISRQPFLERKTNYGTSKKRAYSFPSLFPYYFCLCWHVRLNRLLLDCVESVPFMEKSYQITSSSMNLLSTRDNRFVQIFHRHGDRTPLNNYFAGSDLEKEEVETWKALVRISRCIYSRFQTERMSRLCITCTSLRDTKRILLQTRFLASLHIMEFSRCVMSENNSWECKIGLTCRRRYIWTRSSSSLPRTTITRTY